MKCCMQNVVFLNSSNLPSSTPYSFKTVLSLLGSMVTFMGALSSGKVSFKGKGNFI